MKFTRFAVLALLTLPLMVACDKDPATAEAGKPLGISTTRSEVTLPVDGRLTITAFLFDNNHRRVTGALEAVSAGPAVAIDSVRYVPELAETRVFVRALAEDTEGTDITITGHNLTAITTILVD